MDRHDRKVEPSELEPARPVALALCAHPDDIEFTCAGTLALLKQHGFDIHYMNLGNGCCGSVEMDRRATAAQRWTESERAAGTLGAVAHAPFFNDLEIFYTHGALQSVAARIREIQPQVVLTHALSDYMEDHVNTARLAVSALFVAGMPNYKTEPHTPPYFRSRALYHVMPHGLRNPWDAQRVYPSFYVGIDKVFSLKRAALACHSSQKEWLDKSQGMNAYLEDMAAIAAVLGQESGAGRYAEGLTRHLPIGLGDEDYRPVEETLASYIVLNQKYPNHP